MPLASRQVTLGPPTSPDTPYCDFRCWSLGQGHQELHDLELWVAHPPLAGTQGRRENDCPPAHPSSSCRMVLLPPRPLCSLGMGLPAGSAPHPTTVSLLILMSLDSCLQSSVPHQGHLRTLTPSSASPNQLLSEWTDSPSCLTDPRLGTYGHCLSYDLTAPCWLRGRGLAVDDLIFKNVGISFCFPFISGNKA